MTRVVTSPETIHAAMDAARKQAIADCAKVARDYGRRRNQSGRANRAAAAKVSAADEIARAIEKLGAR